jgi:fructose-1,6-bisphosphatase I
MRADQLSLTSALDRWSDNAADKRALVAVVHAIAEAGIRLSGAVAVAPLEAALANLSPTSRDGEASINASGDEQKPLDLYAEKMVVDALAGLDIAAICSEESAEPILMTPGGSFVVAIDPVDGSSNIDVNAPIGTIFSVLPSLDSADPTAALLQPGRHQLAAGMIIYGAATIMVLTLGSGTDVFVLDPRTRYFRLVRHHIELPADSREYAINAANARHWGPGISEYITDLVSGEHGPRERSFNMRWLASLVAEAYRILTRGGIFLYPADSRPGYADGRIRLLYEANPISFLIEQAGGMATDGVDPILDLIPQQLHQQVPFVFGSQAKVERVKRYLVDPELHQAESPLFSSRGLFRTRRGE